MPRTSDATMQRMEAIQRCPPENCMMFIAMTCPSPVMPTAPTMNPTTAHETATGAELFAPSSSALMNALKFIRVDFLSDETTMIARSPIIAE